MTDTGQADEDPEEKELDIIHNDMRRLKQPNKKKFEEEIDGLKAVIHQKELEIKHLQGLSQKDEGHHKELKNVRSEKNDQIEQRNKIDADLRNLNQEVAKKKDALARLEVNVVYKSADRVDGAIRRLETQLKTHNYKLNEEKKIVSEIDGLRRSKKVLTQYLDLKKEFDIMKQKQRTLREHRDTISKEISQLRNKEEDIRKQTTTDRAKIDELKQAINELYDQKRQMVAEFKKNEHEFYTLKDKLSKLYREKMAKKREEEKRAVIAAKQKEQEEIRKTIEPFCAQKLLCSALMKYLQRFPSSNDLSEHTEQSHAQSEPVQQLEDGLYVLKKKKSDEDLFTCMNRGKQSKRNRRVSKLAPQKCLTHAPETLTQFLSLNLNAPSHVGEIQASIEQLQARKLFYENEAIKPKVNEENKDNLPNLSEFNDIDLENNKPESHDNKCSDHYQDQTNEVYSDKDEHDHGRGVSICETDSNKSDDADEETDAIEDGIQISDDEDMSDNPNTKSDDKLHPDTCKLSKLDNAHIHCDKSIDYNAVNGFESVNFEHAHICNGDLVDGISTSDIDEIHCIKSRLKERDMEQIQHIIKGLHDTEIPLS